MSKNDLTITQVFDTILHHIINTYYEWCHISASLYSEILQKRYRYEQFFK